MLNPNLTIFPFRVVGDAHILSLQYIDSLKTNKIVDVTHKLMIFNVWEYKLHAMNCER